MYEWVKDAKDILIYHIHTACLTPFPHIPFQLDCKLQEERDDWNDLFSDLHILSTSFYYIDLFTFV